MDHFKEEIVVKRGRTIDDVAFILVNVMMYIMAVVAFMMLSQLFSSISMGAFSWPPLVLFLVCGGLAALIYLRKDYLKMEYEYTFTNGDLDFARVLNNSRRKNLGSMKVKNVEAMGFVDGKQFPRFMSMKPMTRSNWFLNRDSKLFYFYFNKDGNKRMIVCEPSDEMVTMIKQYAARGAFQE
ncbi:MAG: hypothetical protein PHI27_08245 [Eubacteriales bacterium]|nr:hypothetical protein [Eubacteriales bacterium]MDD3882229.1 hypothetical protein [Eubacteriales bacterium]MDD4512578.1 hypothetical protein [Eubacteriales bacterium]